MYNLFATKSFSKAFKKRTKNDKVLEKQIIKALNLLRQFPFYPSLKTHKVDYKFAGQAYSSWVTGDLRILWDFNDDQPNLLDLLELGGHSGSNKVYK